ncbi:MAG: IS110 family transposase [Candidatus Dormibacter sp.]|uniref:IS110 family transposase n=1 Tax=Candidatus Dormibacter sp. TaxID=2973982 RepID=UPI003D9B1AE4
MANTTIAQEQPIVTGGVDTHLDIHVAAAVDGLGRTLATSEFSTDGAGHQQMLDWLRGHGRLDRVGVEGTGSYGAGLARFMVGSGIEVIEVSRPDRRKRRLKGKSDVLDAEAAARATLAGTAVGKPKAGTGQVEMIRVLRATRYSAVKARTQAGNQLQALVVTAPDQLREGLRGLSIFKLATKAAGFRRGPLISPEAAYKQALGALARRWKQLGREIAELDASLARVVPKAAPALVSLVGVGAEVAATLLVAAGDNPERLTSESAFAALCGVSPLPASSGKTQRHRLNRGGNRQANRALWTVVMTRLRYDDRTRRYAARRSNEALSKAEIIRCLKRYVAREVYRALPTVVA